jgi:hypothetical protein
LIIINVENKLYKKHFIDMGHISQGANVENGPVFECINRVVTREIIRFSAIFTKAVKEGLRKLMKFNSIIGGML